MTTHFTLGPRSPFSTVGTGMSASWLLSRRARERPNHPFLVWEPFDRPASSWTYATFADAVAKVAAGLRRRSIGHGDLVLIHLENCPEFLLAWFACAWIGAVAVCTNTRSSADELSYYVSHSGAVACVTQPDQVQTVNRAMPHARELIVISANAGVDPSPADSPDAALAFDKLLTEEPMPPPSPFPALEPASIQYTSGTTGRPKAVVWTHANAVWGAKVNAAHLGLRPSDLLLTYLPLFHTNAQSYSVLGALWVGATVVLQPRFSASRFWDVSVRNQCTVASQIFFSLRILQTLDPPRSHSYRVWGAGISAHPVAERFGIPTVGWWGMTETISHPIVGDLHIPSAPRTIGRAAPEYEVAVVDGDGQPVEPGRTGHLLVRGTRGVSLFWEYLHDPDATRDAFDDAGWFKTGDMITVHDGGDLSFADRAKDMLKVGAENVAASEVERVVAGVAGVAEVAVVGAPDHLLEEVPVAFVIPTDGHQDSDSGILEKEIMAACREALADFKVPREVRVVADLPRSTLEKVAKRELRDQLRRDDRQKHDTPTTAPN